MENLGGPRGAGCCEWWRSPKKRLGNPAVSDSRFGARIPKRCDCDRLSPQIPTKSHWRVSSSCDHDSLLPWTTFPHDPTPIAHQILYYMSYVIMHFDAYIMVRLNQVHCSLSVTHFFSVAPSGFHVFPSTIFIMSLLSYSSTSANGRGHKQVPIANLHACYSVVQGGHQKGVFVGLGWMRP